MIIYDDYDGKGSSSKYQNSKHQKFIIPKFGILNLSFGILNAHFGILNILVFWAEIN